MQYHGGKYIISSDVANIISGGNNRVEISRRKVKNSKGYRTNFEGGGNRVMILWFLSSVELAM